MFKFTKENTEFKEQSTVDLYNEQLDKECSEMDAKGEKYNREEVAYSIFKRSASVGYSPSVVYHNLKTWGTF